MTGRPLRTTASARAPTTYGSSAANSSSSNPGRTRRYHVPEPAARIIAAFAHPSRQGHRAPHRRHPHATTGPPAQELDHHSTATTKPSAATCKPCSTTSASPPRRPPRDRQRFVDRVPQPTSWRRRHRSAGSSPKRSPSSAPVPRRERSRGGERVVGTETRRAQSLRRRGLPPTTPDMESRLSSAASRISCLLLVW
jgi:hypothetical protein